MAKVPQRLGFIGRYLQDSPFKSHETTYISLARSLLDYCINIWDPHLKLDIDDLEKVQRKAARSAWVQCENTTVTLWQPLADHGIL